LALAMASDDLLSVVSTAQIAASYKVTEASYSARSFVRYIHPYSEIACVVDVDTKRSDGSFLRERVMIDEQLEAYGPYRLAVPVRFANEEHSTARAPSEPLDSFAALAH